VGQAGQGGRKLANPPYLTNPVYLP